jgi:hypothetical protein
MSVATTICFWDATFQADGCIRNTDLLGRHCANPCVSGMFTWQLITECTSFVLGNRYSGFYAGNVKESLIKSFDKLRMNGKCLIPFVVSLSNQ